MNIGLISDTHNYLDPQVFEYFNNVDEIWHAGDIGNIQLFDQLNQFKPTLGVFGNIDGHKVRAVCPEDQFLDRQGLKIWMTHIGGKPPRYNARTRPIMDKIKPDLFICGHSHICAVLKDPKRPKILYINPGAAGKQGFHKIKTIMRFKIKNGLIKDLQVIELGHRGN